MNIVEKLSIQQLKEMEVAGVIYGGDATELDNMDQNDTFGLSLIYEAREAAIKHKLRPFYNLYLCIMHPNQRLALYLCGYHKFIFNNVLLQESEEVAVLDNYAKHSDCVVRVAESFLVGTQPEEDGILLVRTAI